MSTYWKYRSGTVGRLQYFSPGQFSVPSNSLFKYDASDISTLYQDTLGTTPVTSDSDPVGRWVPIEAQGSNRLQPLSGTGTYFAATTYGPGVQPVLFREQVSGIGGGAFPPGEEDLRFMYLVVSGVGIANSHLMLGYGLGNTNFTWNIGCSGAFWYLYKDSAGLIPPEIVSLTVARTQEQAILMAWYNGTDMFLRVNDNTPVSQTSLEMDTSTSDTNASYGWHLSHTLTSGGYSAPGASQLFTVHESACFDYVPSQAEIDALFSVLNSKWSGIGNVT